MIITLTAVSLAFQLVVSSSTGYFNGFVSASNQQAARPNRFKKHVDTTKLVTNELPSELPLEQEDGRSALAPICPSFVSDLLCPCIFPQPQSESSSGDRYVHMLDERVALNTEHKVRSEQASSLAPRKTHLRVHFDQDHPFSSPLPRGGPRGGSRGGAVAVTKEKKKREVDIEGMHSQPAKMPEVSLCERSLRYLIRLFPCLVSLGAGLLPKGETVAGVADGMADVGGKGLGLKALLKGLYSALEAVAWLDRRTQEEGRTDEEIRSMVDEHLMTKIVSIKSRAGEDMTTTEKMKQMTEHLDVQTTLKEVLTILEEVYACEEDVGEYWLGQASVHVRLKLETLQRGVAEVYNNSCCSCVCGRQQRVLFERLADKTCDV